MKHSFKQYSTAVLFAIALWLALIGSVIHPVMVYATSTGGAGANNPDFVYSLLLADSNTSPDELGELVFDNTVTGITGGALAWYDSNSNIRYVFGVATLPVNDGYVLTYDADNDLVSFEAPGSGVTTFVALTDTPSAFTNANAIYAVNGSGNAVAETTVILAEGTNSFSITQGTTEMAVAADVDIDTALTVNTTAVTLDQSLASTDSPTFNDITVTSPTNLEASLDFVPEDGIEVRTPSSVQSLAAGDSLSVTDAIMRVQGNGGAVTSTATPFFNASGIVDGECVQVEGASDSNLFTLNDESTTAGNNVQMIHNQSMTYGLGDASYFCYNATVGDWFERWRSDN